MKIPLLPLPMILQYCNFYLVSSFEKIKRSTLNPSQAQSCVSLTGNKKKSSHPLQVSYTFLYISLYSSHFTLVMYKSEWLVFIQVSVKGFP